MNHLAISQSITPREYKSLDKYLNEIDKVSLITAEDEVVLSRRIKEGDEQAVECLTKANLRFVVSIAKQYQNRGLTLGDLISEGNFGLIEAAKRFDETKGFRFISYAVWWIRQSIIKALSDYARTVRLPYNKLCLLKQLYKAHSRLEQEFGRLPTIEEIGIDMQLPVSTVNELLYHANGHHLSIDEPFRQNDEHTLLDVLQNNDLGPDYVVNQDSVNCEIYHSLKVLSQRDRELLMMYFGLGTFSPLSLDEIGKKLNLTKEHVGRLKEKALEKLRNCSNAEVLMSCIRP